MERSYLLPVVLGLLCCSVASAQSAISWMDDPKAGVEAAKKSKKPLMIYVLAGTKDRDEEIERGQKRSLADPRVVKMSKANARCAGVDGIWEPSLLTQHRPQSR